MCSLHLQNYLFIFSFSLISLLFEGCSTCELDLQKNNDDLQESCIPTFKLQLLDFSLDLDLEMTLNLEQDQTLSDLQSSDLASDLLALNQQNRLIINEVLINPIGSDSQKEWVEIINPNHQAIDLKGMSLFYQNQLIMECESGVLGGQSFFVIHSNDQTISSALDHELILSAKEQDIQCTTQNFKFNNDHDFRFEIANRNGISIDRFDGLGIEIKNGISLTRLKGGTSSMIIAHDELSNLLEISPPRMHSLHQDLTFDPFSKNTTQINELEILNCRMPQKKQIIINEIMVKPIQTALQDQWIELFNPTTYPLSLEDTYLSFYLKNQNQSDQISDSLLAFPKICIAPKSTCYLWTHPKNLGLLCASDFSFYPIEGLGLDLSAFDIVDISLKRSQVLIDFISFQAEQVQDGVSFNRLIDGSDGPLILHSEIEPHLESSFLRCANGNQWAENCQPKLSLKHR